MNDPTSEHPARYRDAHHVLDIAEVPGLPFPHISSDRAAFYFTGITHARDAAEAVATAETILSYGLDVTFARREAMAGDDTVRYILEAFMPSGLAVDIVARAEHMAGADMPEVVAVAA